MDDLGTLAIIAGVIYGLWWAAQPDESYGKTKLTPPPPKPVPPRVEVCPFCLREIRSGRCPEHGYIVAFHGRYTTRTDLDERRYGKRIPPVGSKIPVHDDLRRHPEG